MALSAKASGTPHPAVLSIWSSASDKFPNFSKQNDHDWVLDTKVGTVPVSSFWPEKSKDSLGLRLVGLDSFPDLVYLDRDWYICPILSLLTAEEVLSWALSTFGDSLAISTSFQKEGMVVIDMAARINPRVRVFTIDTGRLPEETHQMMETVRQRYGIPVEIVFPGDRPRWSP